MPKTVTDTKEAYDVAQAMKIDPLARQAATFRCSICTATRFHKAEFGSLIDGVFVVDEITFRCVGCHTEYHADGKKAE